MVTTRPTSTVLGSLTHRACLGCGDVQKRLSYLNEAVDFVQQEVGAGDT